jgi:hypothetical protein
MPTSDTTWWFGTISSLVDGLLVHGLRVHWLLVNWLLLVDDLLGLVPFIDLYSHLRLLEVNAEREEVQHDVEKHRPLDWVLPINVELAEVHTELCDL